MLTLPHPPSSLYSTLHPLAGASLGRRVGGGVRGNRGGGAGIVMMGGGGGMKRVGERGKRLWGERFPHHGPWPGGGEGRGREGTWPGLREGGGGDRSEILG